LVRTSSAALAQVASMVSVPMSLWWGCGRCHDHSCATMACALSADNMPMSPLPQHRLTFCAFTCVWVSALRHC
jgi:hypothetical protein